MLCGSVWNFRYSAKWFCYTRVCVHTHTDTRTQVITRYWAEFPMLYSRVLVNHLFYVFVVVQLLSRVQLFETSWTTAHQVPLSSTISEFARLNDHWVGDAIQPAHPLSSPSPPFNLSQHQGLFQWVGSLQQVAKVLVLLLQNQSFQWIFRAYFL